MSRVSCPHYGLRLLCRYVCSTAEAGDLAVAPGTAWAVYRTDTSIVFMRSLQNMLSYSVRWYDLTLGGGGVLAQHGHRAVPAYAEGRLVVYVGFGLPRAVGAGRQGTAAVVVLNCSRSIL
jgi:hypothetical protein